jgi:hypothetical protein
VLDRLHVHLHIALNHHLLEHQKVVNREQLNQEVFLNLGMGFAARGNKVLRMNAEILNERLQLAVDKFLKPIMHICVFQTVLLGILKHDAVLVNKVDDRVLPSRRG